MVFHSLSILNITADRVDLRSLLCYYFIICLCCTYTITVLEMQDQDLRVLCYIISYITPITNLITICFLNLVFQMNIV